jgi:hypothetical protein
MRVSKRERARRDIKVRSKPNGREDKVEEDDWKEDNKMDE